MQMRDFVVRFAGEGGQGVVTSAEGLAQSSTQVGYHALTFATFPSQILGGPTWTQARIAVDPVLAPGDDVDVLVAFNQEAYDNHVSEVREDGVVIFNSTEFQLEGDSRAFGLPVEELARSTGNNRAANMVIMGALSFVPFAPSGPLDRFTVLPIQIFVWISKPQEEFHHLAAAGIVVLLIMLLGMNAFAIFLRNRLQKNQGG